MAIDGVKRIVTRSIVLGGLFAGAWFALSFVLVTRAASDAQGASGVGDAIVVLGAAQYNGEPSPVLESRLNTALELYESDAAEQIVTTGSNQPGDVFTEGFAAFRFLRNAGVAEDQIVVIVDGGDTYESLLATRNQLPADGRSVVIVTDPYHALRSRDIATEVGLDAVVVGSSSDTAFVKRLRESVAVSLGRIVSYRRLSAWR